jgi:hypothetical protein
MFPPPNGSQGYRQATNTTWLTRAGGHAQTLHERFFCNLQLPHLQLDELRTRLRSYKQVLWLWLAIDPLTKILPVLQLGPRTQNMAHLFIHSLRQSLAPGCLPLFTSDGLNLYFYALTAHFGHWLEVGRRGRKVRQWQVAAGLIYGQVKKSRPLAQAGSGHARDAPWSKRRSQGRLAGIRLLGTAEHRFYRTGESDGPSWHLSTGTPHLGHGEAFPTPAGSSAMVACLLPFCTSPRIITHSARTAARARRQVGSATLPTAYASDGSRENQPTVDNTGSLVLSLATSAMLQTLSVNEA